MMQPRNFDDTIAKFNQLYITTRRKYIYQDGEVYKQANVDKRSNNFPLTDVSIKRHLEGTKTYGVFNANTVNKFITFDIDFSDDMPMARWAARKLVDVLYRDFSVPFNDIHVSYSGNKGYHIDLFLDKPIKLSDAVAFYEKVRKHAELTEQEVEFRPTYKQGVKLPLGVHAKTGNRCWFVDRETLEPIESFDYLNDVEPMDHTVIMDSFIELTQEQTEDYEAVVRATDTTVNVVTEEKAFGKVKEILDEGKLLHSGSRHDITVLLASFCNMQGCEREKAKMMILDIMDATPTEFFSKTTTREFIESETERIVNLAYGNDYKLGNSEQCITIYKSEILAVLKVGTFRQKQLAYAMLITSKRYGDVFYLTMETAMDMIGTSAKQTVDTGIKKLAEVGFIEYVSKGQVDKARSMGVGSRRYKPNRYRLLIEKPQADDCSVEVMTDQTLVDVTGLLLDKTELLKYVKRSEFAGRWAKERKAI